MMTMVEATSIDLGDVVPETVEQIETPEERFAIGFFFFI